MAKAKTSKKETPDLDSLLEKVKLSMGETFYDDLYKAIECEKVESYARGRNDYRDRMTETSF